MPHVSISVGDGPASVTFYAYATRRHRYFIIKNKCWGAALLKLPDTFTEYIQGKSKTLLRRQQRAAVSGGYYCDQIVAVDHLDAILEVNASCSTRQGYPIRPSYLDKGELLKYFSGADPVFAVRDNSGVVRAYAHVLIFGEVALLSRLLGHSEHLENGVMYLLISAIIRALCERKATSGSPLWLMYDMMFGGGDGLRFFKERLGFEPYHVSWFCPRPRAVDFVTVSREEH